MPRESSGTGIYHVMLRGINRQDIFDDTEDYWTFIRMMSEVPCYIYAYCLMSNHITEGRFFCYMFPKDENRETEVSGFRGSRGGS